MVSRFARLALAGGTVSLLAGLSMKTVGEFALGDRLTDMDAAILRTFAGLRSGFLNGAAVDFTSLGSGTLLVVVTAVVFVMLVSTRDAYGALHLLLAGTGAGLFTWFFKQYFARPRPTVVEHLVKVAHYSYPSGHAVGIAACYFSFALIARRHLPRHATREFLIGFTLLTIVLVGMSRVYLGVHYASDVIAGTLMGVGWSLLLAGAFSMHERSRQRRSAASLIAEPQPSASASPLAIDNASSSVPQK
jgi:membrane-associated phospholipid phosphatase